MPKLEHHPIADIFPMMSEEEYEGLREDIRQHGQREPITVWRGLLVDGRNRLRACEELGIEPEIGELLEETDPVQYAFSQNLHRRHLTVAQRAMIADELAKMQQGQKKPNSGIPLSQPTQAEAASMLNVSVDSVKQARRVKATAKPDVVAAVERGEISLNAAVATAKPKATTKPKATAKSRATGGQVKATPISIGQFEHQLRCMSLAKKPRKMFLQVADIAFGHLKEAERLEWLTIQLLKLDPEDLGGIYDNVDQRQNNKTGRHEK